MDQCKRGSVKLTFENKLIIEHGKMYYVKNVLGSFTNATSRVCFVFQFYAIQFMLAKNVYYLLKRKIIHATHILFSDFCQVST